MVCSLHYSGRPIIAVFLLFIAIYAFLSSVVHVKRSFRVIHLKTTEHESILLYRAYYDNRTGPGRLRILAISSCLSLTLPPAIHLSTGAVLPLVPSPIEKFCPWKWAPDCKWNAFHFESPPLPLPPAKAFVSLSGRSVEIEVASLPPLQDTLQVCVPPLYWYNDWPRLLLSLEFWRREGAALSIYLNSVSADVKRVLDFYQEQGTITVIHWPKLPTLKEEDPNRSVYRLSHSLAHNDCVLRSTSRFTMLLDLDEFIVARNSSLLDLAKAHFDDDSTLGSLTFPHHGLVSDSELDESLAALASMEVKRVNGPSKVLFDPSSTLFLSTHFVNTHVDGFHEREISADEGLLLHNRISFGDKEIGDRVDIGDRFSKGLKEAVGEMTKAIFGESLPTFSLNVTNEVVRCTSRWRSLGCKTPLSSCYSTLISMDDWIFLPPSPDSHFTVL